MIAQLMTALHCSVQQDNTPIRRAANVVLGRCGPGQMQASDAGSAESEKMEG